MHPATLAEPSAHAEVERATTGPTDAPPAPRSVGRTVASLLLAFAVAFLLVFAKTMARRLNPDENVFVAAAALWSRDGLLPYRDFHYNHLPTLVYVYGWLFKLSDHLLLVARLFSIVCSAATVAVVFHVAGAALAGWGKWRWWLAAAVAGAMLANPVFTQTSGLAWNHDFPTLLTLLAFLTVCRALRPAVGGYGWLLVAGVLTGLAITARLTFAPVAGALGIMVLARGGYTPGHRARLLAAFSAGMLLAAVPAIWMIARSPDNALWGNLRFPRLNTRYFAEGGSLRGSVFGKIRSLLKYAAQPGNAALLAGLLLLFIPVTRSLAAGARKREHVGLIVLIAFLVIGALIPTPIFEQYLFAPLPFVAVALAWAAGAAADRRGAVIWLTGVAAVSLAFGAHEYVTALPRAPFPSQWEPVRTHQQGLTIREHVGPGAGPVLTFCPILPLEGGLPIYPGLATAHYAYRVDDYVSEDRLARLKSTDDDDVQAMFASPTPPAAILTGFTFSDEFERPWVSFATMSRYTQVELPPSQPIRNPDPRRPRRSLILWIRPPAPEGAGSADTAAPAPVTVPGHTP